MEPRDPPEEPPRPASRKPEPSRGILSDLRIYVIRRPPRATLVQTDSPREREDLNRRILQRLGLDVASYGVLNVHRIGVEAPVRCVFEELRSWEVTESCWPRHLVGLERVDGRLDCLRARLLGGRRSLFGFRHGLLGLARFVPIFQLDLLELREGPGPLDVDNTRYVTWACSGGYPIGILSVVVRSPLPSLGERERSQVFFVVSFDFWGKKRRWRLVRPLWEWIHNRVTANVLDRFRAICLARFQELTEGPPPGSARGETPPP